MTKKETERDPLLPRRRPSDFSDTNFLYDMFVHGVGLSAWGYVVASAFDSLDNLATASVAGIIGLMSGAVKNVLTRESTEKVVQYTSAPENAVLIEVPGQDGSSQRAVVVTDRAGNRTTLLNPIYSSDRFNRADEIYSGRLRRNDSDKLLVELEAEKKCKDTAETIRSGHEYLLGKIESELASKGDEI